MVVLDTDVLLLAFAFQRDDRQPANEAFLERAQSETFARPFARMRAVQMPFMDAVILILAERAPDVSHFVTWNARHFQGKSTLNVLTPEAYLQQSES